jgi:hypothetical protein
MATTPSERLYERVRAAVADAPAPRTTRTQTRIAVALAILPVLTTLVVLTASQLVYRQPAAGLGIDVVSAAGAWTLLVLLAGLALASTLFALRQGRTGLGIGSTSLILVAALVVPVYAALTLVQPLHSGVADDIDISFAGVAISPWGLRCLLIAIGVSATALVIFASALRRAVAVASVLRGAALGAAAGAWGGLAVFAFCPSGELQHLLVGHVLPIAAFTVIGACLLPRALRP